MKGCISVDFVTAGVNNEPGSLDEHAGFIIYGAGQNVLLGRNGSHSRNLIALPAAPKGRVHVVRWIHGHGGEGEDRRKDGDEDDRDHKLGHTHPPAHSHTHEQDITGAVVASEDGTVRLYARDALKDVLDWTAWHLTASWDLAAPAILCDWTRANDGGLFITAATTRGTIHAVTVPATDSMQLVHSFGNRKVTALAVERLPASESAALAIFAAVSDSTLRILVPLDEGGQWNERLALTGHHNWITWLSTIAVPDEQSRPALYIASASLDRTIRIWKIVSSDVMTGESVSNKNALLELVPQRTTFVSSAGVVYSCVTDALALGHDGAVYYARFLPPVSDTRPSISTVRIVSGSADRSVIVWRQGWGGVWSTDAQLGNVNTMGSIGTDHTFAFYATSMYADGDETWIVGAASTGAILFWKRTEAETGWTAQAPITGHCGRVEACVWGETPTTSIAASASFLLTLSQDQTTRAFARFSRPSTGYFEVGRPQIHGYDLKCLALVARTTVTGVFSGFELLSGADEKVLRVFTAPVDFYRQWPEGRVLLSDDALRSRLPAASATLSPLGLTNKSREDDTDPTFTRSDADDTSQHSDPPTETELQRASLWPETDKLYGHNQELFSVAVNASGTLAASAAKSHLAMEAALHLWQWTRTGVRVGTDVVTEHMSAPNQADGSGQWAPLATVAAHTLTVTKLVFSPDERLLLSVSRDRHFVVLQMTSPAQVIQRHEAHARIIWAADWCKTPAANGHFGFVTASRDRTLKSWCFDETTGQWICEQVVTMSHGVTAVAIRESGHLAVGDETGAVRLFLRIDEQWNEQSEMAVCGGGGIGACADITDLKWRPGPQLVLAVVSADHSVRIYNYSQYDM